MGNTKSDTNQFPVPPPPPLFFCLSHTHTKLRVILLKNMVDKALCYINNAQARCSNYLPLAPSFFRQQSASVREIIQSPCA